MKNVVINKVVKYIFTEDQLRGLWRRSEHEITYDDLTNEQVIKLAKGIMKKASHSELEEFTIDSQWRLPSDMTGKIIAQDDSDPTEHIEIIDTDLSDMALNDMVIDRLMKVKCSTCDFQFYIDNLEEDVTKLHCPQCEGKVITIHRETKTLKKEDES
ncbi:DNA-directed RNA polymerase subunit RPC12/RpoP [Pullulanibacillus pueri]|uniref:Uncharacterized protein n=1 Tax=Pullulanibacillus pueri TaxID=1437324 RepID=A0A8J2ZXH5_9BACL|nr:hypothetical protein [Pullulanibacillus pueri]MBM7683082.1 DNA-directed RNA polymerase subunit RPC12/RpoP [Pullulanibacillus pueri]GGH84862.1 hypothetical protein GCM10007096_28910 [Pullulanibacillus pueri]